MRPELKASEFQASSVYTSMGEKGKKIAYDYLVRGLPVKTISATHQCTPQNVHASAKCFLGAVKRHQEARKRVFS